MHLAGIQGTHESVSFYLLSIAYLIALYAFWVYVLHFFSRHSSRNRWLLGWMFPFCIALGVIMTLLQVREQKDRHLLEPSDSPSSRQMPPPCGRCGYDKRHMGAKEGRRKRNPVSWEGSEAVLQGSQAAH